MYFLALAADYDGTLAEDGVVSAATLDALTRLKASGRRLLMVTGRELPDLRTVFSRFDLFDLIVAENGALMFEPATGEEEQLAPPPPPQLVERLQFLNVEPLSVGRTILATWEPNETVVLGAIHQLGLEHQIIFNKGAVMVLPPNVNKATGLAAALKELDLSAYSVVGVGDAENDHAFLMSCGCAVAVDNALPAVKAKADFITKNARGAGVVELIDHLLADDLADVAVALLRHRVWLGNEEESAEQVYLSPRDGGTLVCGTPGKSALAAGLAERAAEMAFQVCVLDTEGDYEAFRGAVVLGDARQPPRMDKVLDLLARPGTSVVANLTAVDDADRPQLFAEFIPKLCRLHAKTGRPQWLVADEAQDLLALDGASPILTRDLPATLFVAARADRLSPQAASMVRTVIAVGPQAKHALEEACGALGETTPAAPNPGLGPGEAYVWRRQEAEPALRRIRVGRPKLDQQRHIRKYTSGELGKDLSFYFRGPHSALNLRAQNLSMFLQLAEGIDDRTWLHHLRAGDYSAWFRSAIKDPELADAAANVEADLALLPSASRARIAELIDRRYIGPASAAETR